MGTPDPYLFSRPLLSNVAMSPSRLSTVIASWMLVSRCPLPMIQELERGIDHPVFRDLPSQAGASIDFLCADPSTWIRKFLILDEAASTIYGDREEIIRNMAVLGAGHDFIIAHRLSTIQDADPDLGSDTCGRTDPTYRLDCPWYAPDTKPTDGWIKGHSSNSKSSRWYTGIYAIFML